MHHINIIDVFWSPINPEVSNLILYTLQSDFGKVSSAKILCSILNSIKNVQIHQNLFHQMYFKPGAYWLRAGVCLVSKNHFHAGEYVWLCVHVCVFTLEAINN